ncbi:MAG: cobalamin-dependent protein, partial [Thermoplasmata archaeon]|nr:cobalamin-dependent protein [Thermoplasmata archaeon]
MPISSDEFHKAVERPARILTAVAAYDGHDASILAINRSLRECSLPVEVIYQGYNKKVGEVVQAAVEEGVDCVAVSSYNGGHNQFYPALVKALRKAGSPAIVVGGGGGTISEEDAAFIEKSGVERIYGTEWSLDGLARNVVNLALKNIWRGDLEKSVKEAKMGNKAALSRMVDLTELLALMRRAKKTRSRSYTQLKKVIDEFNAIHRRGKVVFIMGDGGAGKSTITDELVRHFTMDFEGKKRCAILSIDPTTVRSGEMTALLGDRIRMNNIHSGNIFMRSLATRVPYGNFPEALRDIIDIFRAVGYDLIIVETPGTGQAGIDFHAYDPDLTVYIKTKEFGSVEVQLQKDQLLKEADVIVLNKIDREGSQTVFEQIESILSHARFHWKGKRRPQRAFATQAKMANDPGTLDLYVHLMKELGMPSEGLMLSGRDPFESLSYMGLVPHHRRNYLGRIVEAVRNYDHWVEEQINICRTEGMEKLDPYCRKLLANWQERWNEMTVERTKKDCTTRELEYVSFNGIRIPKVAFPDPKDTVECLRFLLEEGLPGDFPFVNGVFPLRRESGMETTRQFAGLRLAEHTNERFHFLSQGVKNPRLSTAFDGITLYGDDSDSDPGSVGKIGEGGVAVDTLDDMKILYSDFDFREISTSMTINGPAPIILAMYFNVACDYMIEEYKKGHPEEVVKKRGRKKPLLPRESGRDDIDPEYGL